jgi:hypothetical protein
MCKRFLDVLEHVARCQSHYVPLAPCNHLPTDDLLHVQTIVGVLSELVPHNDVEGVFHRWCVGEGVKNNTGLEE